PLLPSKGTSRVLLTTRDTSIARKFGVDLLKPVDEAQALEILHAYAGKALVEQDQADTARLVSAGGGLPLALEVLGKAANDVGSLKAIATDAAVVTSKPLDALFEGAWERLDPNSQTALCAMGDSPPKAVLTRGAGLFYLPGLGQPFLSVASFV